MKIYLLTGKTPGGLTTNERKTFVLKSMKFTMIEGELYRLGRDAILRRCVPNSARKFIIEEAHSSESGGHFSGDITARKILQSGLWWEALTRDVTMFCKKCDICK